MAPARVVAAAGGRPAAATPWQCTVLLPVVALCAGCVDSYPTQDVVTVSPYEMTQAQRIEALNVLGARAGTEGRWRYAVDEAHVL